MPLPGDLNSVVLTGTFTDPAGNPMRGTVTIWPSSTLLDATGNVIIPQLQRAYQLFNGSFRSAPLVATDNTDINPSGWGYVIQIALQEVPSYQITVLLPASESPVDLSALSPATSAPELASYLSMAGGTVTGKLTLTGSTPLQIPGGAALGEVLTSDASGNASWGPSATAPATSSTAGIVELTSDLGGTATAPHVVGTHLASPLPVNQGGTGSGTQNFADLTNAQNIGGVKTFTGEVIVPTPGAAGDAVTKAYADAISTGLQVKPAAVAATTGSETFTVSAGNVTTISGTTLDTTVSPQFGDFILIKDAPVTTSGTSAGSVRSSATGNGLYSVTGNTTNLSVSRATAMSSSNSPVGAFVFTTGGTTNAGAGYVVTTPASGAFTYGSGAIQWTQFSSAGAVSAGTGLSQSGPVLSLTSPVTIAHGGTGSTSQNFAGLLTQTATVTHSASPYTASAGQFVCADTTSGTVTVTLPNAPGDLTVVAVKMVASASPPNAVTINCTGSDVFNKTGGSTSATLTILEQSSVFQYQHSAGIWLKQTGDVPLAQTDTRYLTVFNVKNYGAAGNGSTDDTAAWTAALAAAVAAGTAARGNGGMVLFPPGGHYMINEMDFSSAATANVAVHVVADGAIIEHNASGGGVFVNFAGIPSTATLLDSSFTGATLYPKQSSTNPTTDLIYMTAAFRNKLDVRVFDPGLFASSSGSALHMYGRAGQGIYYSEISLRVTPGPGYTNSYGGTVFTIDGQDGLGGGTYIQSNRFPVMLGHHSLGTGFNDLGSGENLYQLVDMEYNAGYGLVMSQYSFGVRFDHFYFEGNNSSGDQWSLPLSSTNGASNRFIGSLAVSPSAAEVAWWGFYNDCAYLESGGSDQSMFSPILQAGLQTNGWHYPRVYGATNEALFGMKVQGDTADRVNFQIDSSGQPSLLMGIGSAAPDILLERIAAGRWGPGSTVVWQPFGGEAQRTAPISSGPHNIAHFERLVLCDATSGAYTVNLNSSQGIPGEIHTITKIDSSAYAITIACITGSFTIGGASTYTLSAQWQSLTVVCSASFNWVIVGTSGGGALTLDGTATDILAPGTQAAGSSGLAAKADHVHPSTTAVAASEMNFSAWNGDILTGQISTSFGTNPASGTVYLARINVRSAVTISKIGAYWTKPTGGSPANTYLGLYNDSGTMVGSATSDQTATSTGFISPSITSQTLSAGKYWVAFLIGTQGGTPGGLVAFNAPIALNGLDTMNIVSAHDYRWCVNGTGASSLPGSLTLSSNATTAIYPFWCALL